MSAGMLRTVFTKILGRGLEGASRAWRTHLEVGVAGFTQHELLGEPLALGVTSFVARFLAWLLNAQDLHSQPRFTEDSCQLCVSQKGKVRFVPSVFPSHGRRGRERSMLFLSVRVRGDTLLHPL